MAFYSSLSGTSKSLLLTACLFFTISFFQYIASLPLFANSLALRADCLSMFIDGLSYLGNLAADMNTDPRSKKQMELVVAGLSLTLLLGFTLVFFFDALNEVFSQSISHDDDTVNAKIGNTHTHTYTRTHLYTHVLFMPLIIISCVLLRLLRVIVFVASACVCASWSFIRFDQLGSLLLFVGFLSSFLLHAQVFGYTATSGASRR
mmetsp:Transcript_46765/g.60116  ORF Transcript_46765/g.60116 Transcript_46765/m.60116 type:complete len:205 (+) Transcript_46765:117-731(+)